MIYLEQLSGTDRNMFLLFGITFYFWEDLLWFSVWNKLHNEESGLDEIKLFCEVVPLAEFLNGLWLWSLISFCDLSHLTDLGCHRVGDSTERLSGIWTLLVSFT